jgi:hypothetical protein
MRRIALALAVLSLALSGAVQADVSKLKPAAGSKPPSLAAYDALVIEDLADAVGQRPADPAQAERYAAEVRQGGARFATLLGEKITAERNSFKSIAREAGEGRALVVGGRITAFSDANLAQSYIGLGAGDRLEALVELKDGASGELLGTIEIKLSGGVLPGATNLVRTMGNFLESASARVRDEILIAKGDKRREQTGRQGRLREKYSRD